MSPVCNPHSQGPRTAFSKIYLASLILCLGIANCQNPVCIFHFATQRTGCMENEAPFDVFGGLMDVPVSQPVMAPFGDLTANSNIAMAEANVIKAGTCMI